MKPSSALERLKEARKASRGLTSIGHSAAKSDAENEAYLQQLDEAFGGLTAQSVSRHSGGQLTPPAQEGRHQLQQAPATKGAHASRCGQASTTTTTSCQVPAAFASGSGTRGTGVALQSEHVHSAPVISTWRTGPLDQAGVWVQVSERPLLCSAVMTDGSGNVVVGSSDHALYVVDANAGRKKRTLYSKTTGHTEWVTCVCCLPGGRVLSGGMDGRLWLWPAAGTAGAEVRSAHDAPVSKVACLTPQPAMLLQPAAASARHAAPRAMQRSSSSRTAAGTKTGALASAAGTPAGAAALAVSCSYDKTVKLWDVSGRTVKQAAVLCGHTGPVVELAVAPGGDMLLTGDRKGSILCWEVTTGSSGWAIKGAHAGHVTALAWQQQQQQAAGSVSVSLSGGQDGVLKVWDSRSGSCVAQQVLHVDERGRGAIGGIVTVPQGGHELVVTAGADQTLKVVQPTAGYKTLHTVHLTDFPYSLAAVGDGLVVCGCGDGSVHVVDAERGETLYALGAGQAAVRCLDVAPASLVCCGDDGCVVAYSY